MTTCNMTLSTIGEEKSHNPRLQVSDRAACIDLMDSLVRNDPKMMDVGVPVNRKCSLANAA